MDNTVTLIGTTTRDAEMRFTASGTAVTSFAIAVNRKWQNRQTNEWEEEVAFVDVTVWGEMGENFAESIPKGTRVICQGRLKQDNWETENGDKRSKLVLVADEVGPSLRWATAQVVKTERRES